MSKLREVKAKIIPEDKHSEQKLELFHRSTKMKWKHAEVTNK